MRPTRLPSTPSPPSTPMCRKRSCRSPRRRWRWWSGSASRRHTNEQLPHFGAAAQETGTTAERLAHVHKVGHATSKRDDAYAKAIDTIAALIREGLEWRITEGATHPALVSTVPQNGQACNTVIRLPQAETHPALPPRWYYGLPCKAQGHVSCTSGTGEALNLRNAAGKCVQCVEALKAARDAARQARER